MDSLLANYASSDEEEDQQPHKPTPSTTTSSSSSSSFFSTLPPPKSSSSSLFQSLPPPKQSSSASASASASDSSARTLSNSSQIPKPKSQFQEQQPKRVVQFRPPIIPLPNPTDLEDDDDEVDEEEEERSRRRKLESSTQTPSVKSFLSTIPAPRNTATLGVQASSGSARRSIIETDASSPAAPTPTPAAPVPEPPASSSAGEEIFDQNVAGYENYQYGTEQYGSYGDYSWGTEPEAGAVYGNNGDDAYANYAAYGDQGQYENKWIDRSAPEASGVSDTTMIFPSKRRRNEVPTEVIEVKQDELMKNRPREDQAKITGIAFGPSYMPVSSAKGKPTKLHKRKHQIGSLYFDMKQNEMKLAERRAKGMLTKAETQAKYGW